MRFSLSLCPIKCMFMQVGKQIVLQNTFAWFPLPSQCKYFWSVNFAVSTTVVLALSVDSCLWVFRNSHMDTCGAASELQTHCCHSNFSCSGPGKAWWMQQRPWSLLFRPYYKLGLLELYPTATRKEGDFERLLRIMRHQSSPDKKEPFFLRLNQVSTLVRITLLLKSDWATLWEIYLQMCLNQQGAQWGQELSAERCCVCGGDSVSSVVFYLNLHVHIVIEM